MINRVFKTMFIMTLCLGITITSNAAGVQVSDGSAFITKSELSYQLNNLSSRMTQLENSLDSKIDTLVSSYLTRNGIWNGIKQTIVTSVCPFPTPAELTNSGGIVYDVATNGTKFELFKANKSGLAFVTGTYNSNTTAWTNHGWGYYRLSHTDAPGKNLYDDSLVAGLYFLSDTDEVLTVYSLGNGRAISNSMSGSGTMGLRSYNLAISIPKDDYTIVNNFFVEKDKRYYFQFRALITAGGNDMTHVSRVSGNGRYCPRLINIY